MNFENKLALGNGIYTIPDISQILRIPNPKVNRYLKNYWDGNLGQEYGTKYSWSVDLTKAVNFHTLVELYTFFQISDAGVNTRTIIKSHKELSQYFNTPFPFALQEILEHISTDGKKIYFEFENKGIIQLDGTKQFNLEFIKIFFKKLDFGDDSLATRLWPIGKDKSILCDPRRKFGLPTIEGTNIFPETIFEMYKAGDSKRFLSETFNLNSKQINDAIEYCEKAA